MQVELSPKKTAAKRAVLIAFALDLDLALDFALASAPDVALNLALDLAFDRAIALPRDIDRDREIAIALALALDLDLDLSRDIEISRDIARDVARDVILNHRPRTFVRARTLDLSIIIMHPGMIKGERNSVCLPVWNALKQPHRKPRASVDRILRDFQAALNLPPLAQQPSEEDAQQCFEYLNCTRRIIECREAAERVTQAVWNRVCERLLAPPRAE